MTAGTATLPRPEGAEGQDAAARTPFPCCRATDPPTGDSSQRGGPMLVCWLSYRHHKAVRQRCVNYPGSPAVGHRLGFHAVMIFATAVTRNSCRASRHECGSV